LVEEWEDLADYARALPKSIKAGSSYQLRKSKNGVEIKVRVCRYGYSKEFKDEDDVELIKILAFCKVEEFIKVIASTPTDLFFA
jgi:uncharacterized protein YacL (UPF0231 family)